MKPQFDPVTQAPDPWFGDPDFKLPRSSLSLERLDKGWRESQFAQLQQSLYRGRSGLEVSLGMTEATDRAVIRTLQQYTRQLRLAVPFAVVAIGGYGAGQIAPLSDIELRIVSTKPPHEFESLFPDLTKMRNKIETLGLAWDHGVHPISFPATLRPGFDGYDHPEPPGGQTTVVRWVETMSSLLSARLLYGEPQIFLEYSAAIDQMVKTHHRALLTQLREMKGISRAQYGEHDSTPHNLKSSGGGLRESNFIDWEYAIGRILGKQVMSDQEMSEFKELQSRQLAVKQVLHMAYTGGKRLVKKELYTLTDSKIVLLPFRPGGADPVRDVERIADHAERVYFETAQHVAHLVDKVHRRGDWVFGLTDSAAHQTEADRLGAKISDMRAASAPQDEIIVSILQAYRSWQERLVRNGNHTEQIRKTNSWNSLIDSLDPLVREFDHSSYRSAAVSASFRELLGDLGRMAPAIERLSQAGYLDQLSPSIGAAKHKPLHSGRPGQTIDGHTFEALTKLDQLWNDTALQERLGIREQMSRLTAEDREEIGFALLLHDTGLLRQGTRSHAEIGAALAIRDAKSLNFSDPACQRISNLVLNHSYLTRTSQRQRVTKGLLEQVSERIPDESMLLKTLIVDWADSSSSPRYSRAKEAQLVNLYTRARQRLVSGEKFMEALSVGAESILEEANLLRVPGSPALQNSDLVSHLKALPEDYALNTHPRIIAAQLALVNELINKTTTGTKLSESAPLLRWLPAEDERSRTLVFVAPDSNGLFARITGALAENALNIEDARIATRKDHPIACDAFTIPFTYDVEEIGLRRSQGFILQSYNRPNLLEQIWEKRPSLRASNLLPARGHQRGSMIEIVNDAGSEATSITVRATGDYRGLASVFGISISNELGYSIIHANLASGGEHIKNHFLVVDGNNQPISPADFERVEKALLRAILRDDAKS